MPSVFYDLLGMNGFVYDESESPHHMPHLHVYAGSAKLEFYFDGRLKNGNIKLLTHAQRRKLRAWIMSHQKLLSEKWKEMNSHGEP